MLPSLRKSLSTLQPARGNFIWRNIASVSAVKAIRFSLKLKIIPIVNFKATHFVVFVSGSVQGDAERTTEGVL